MRGDFGVAVHGTDSGCVDDREFLADDLFDLAIVAHVAVKKEGDVDFFHRM